MISIILGHKGAGKTKRLVECVNAAVQSSKGNVVCVEKETQLTYDVSYQARLIATDDYDIKGYKAFAGFLAGVCAGNHDITDVLVDATLRIGGRNYDALAEFLEEMYELSSKHEKNFVFTISADKEELPAAIFNFCQVI